MAKKVIEVVSDGSEKPLAELVERFSVKRALAWLRVKFPSFDTARAETLACDATKNEKEYFASAELLGYVTRLPSGGGGHAGRVTLPSGDANRPLLVAAVRMRKDLTERTSRLVQFNYAKKLLQNAVTQGAQGVSGLPSQGLFFFYDRDGFFRLSLVTGEVEKRRFRFSAAKRQSFYIEPQGANNIVRRRLCPPIKTFAELKDAFSVEQLTREFYTRLFDWYTWALSPEVNTHFPNDLDDKTDDRKYNHEAVIRLITRLMFTWFIRQRRLVPDLLFDREGLKDVLKGFEPDSMEQDTYYRAILQNLFFATFNCKSEKRRFIHAFQGKSGERHVTTLYRYEREFRDADGFKALMRKVPFLNCALFDCLDKVERAEDGGRTLYFDGFSGRGANYQAHVPNGLFFDGERGLVNLFNLYEFTVNENSADDSDVALDPELLGKVFENLLGAFNPETQETARNATGSFYTPREIVDYMVEESLKAYLRARLGETRDARREARGAGDARLEPRGAGDASREGASRLASPVSCADLAAKLDDLFDRGKAAETLFSPKEREEILDALYNCRILDPACGSGAFPMGVLHCMVRLLTRLDPQCISIRERLLARYREDKATVDPTETAEERRERLEELESRLKEGQHYPDYERKLYLIENCIYGVDIQPIATQISKLRFFISLLCDQLRSSFDSDAENFGLLSLPNLEAKFVCANTLVSLPEVGALDASAGNIDALRGELQRNRHKIFRARSTRTKEKYKRKDLEIRDAIRQAVYAARAKPDEDVIAKCREQIADAKRRRTAVSAPDWYEEEVAVQTDLFATVERKRVRKDRNKPERDRIDAEIAWAEKKIAEELAKGEKSNVSAAEEYAKMVAGWDPYEQNASSGFFDPEWMFNIRDGFDVVIGNPPYISHDQIPSNVPCRSFECFEPFADIYCYFYEQGVKLLSQGGVLEYITSNSYLRANYGLPLREFLRRKVTIDKLIDIEGTQIFESAVVNAVITEVSKGVEERNALVTAAMWNGISFRSFVIENSYEYAQNDFDTQPWTLVKPECLAIRRKLEASGKTLEQRGAKIRLGLATGDNHAFVLDSDGRRKLIDADKNNAAIIKPVLGGRDIHRYCHSTPQYLLLTKNGVNVKRDYPTVYEYLSTFGSAFKKRGAQGEHWTNLRACAFFDDFKKEKIIWIDLTDQGRFSYSDKEEYLLNSAYFMLPIADVDTKALLGLLNSSTIMFYMKQVAATSGMGTLRWINNYVKLFPIPNSISAQQKPIIALVDRILSAKRSDPGADTAGLEREIDRLVYGLYGLTEEEIAVVEGRGGGHAGGRGGGHAGRVTLPGGRARDARREGARGASDEEEELE